MNWERVGQLAEIIAPALVQRYYASRILAGQLKRAYEAARPTQQHPLRGGAQSADAANELARGRLTAHARWLDENAPLAVSVLDVLVNHVVGTGLWPAPMMKNRAGDLYESLNEDIEGELQEFARAPDVTGENHWGEVQRLQARSLFRDGELLIQHVAGGRFPFPGQVPYLFESLETDYLPYDLYGDRTGNPVVHGIEKGPGGRPVTYHIYRQHPGALSTAGVSFGNTVPIPAASILHLKVQRRLGQTRGVSIFHAVIKTIGDINNISDSERIAAQVNAALTAYIKKNRPTASDPVGSTGQRYLEMSPGTILDDLLPGEEIGVIDSKRPNSNMVGFLQFQQRDVAAGTGTGSSAITRDFSGSYASQRQELVETDPNYARFNNYFKAKAVSSVYRRWLDAATLVNQIRIPRDADPRSFYDHEVNRPPMPWVDMLKEVQADALAVENNFKSRAQVQRDKFGDPRRIDREIARDAMAAKVAPPPPPPAAPDDDDASPAAIEDDDA